ncbi:hypothetical protein TNCV_2025761 [Trichonephila clavipes]|nr:hypothetical protein TNCV_2025761 [Trichonephila clavipes]
MHPPYSPDLAPSDYDLFLAMQNFLSEKKLGSREDCENRLLECFANKDQDFYERGYCEIQVPKSNFPPGFKFEADSIPMQNLQFLGMVSVHIPVRPSAVEAVRNFRNAGIKIKKKKFNVENAFYPS